MDVLVSGDKMDFMKIDQLKGYARTTKLFLKSLLNPVAMDEKAEINLGGLMAAIIMGVVTIVVALLLGTAILPSSITGISNTSAIAGYSTWSSGTQSMWVAIPIFAVLSFFLLFVAVVLVIMKIADK